MRSHVHRTYRISDVIAVTQRLDDGTWLATFPGFTGFGAAESDALNALANEVEGASKRIRLEAIEIANIAAAEPTTVIVRSYRAPNGDVCGQIVNASSGEVLHETGWGILVTEALQDAEQIAQRKGYIVVRASK